MLPIRPAQVVQVRGGRPRANGNGHKIRARRPRKKIDGTNAAAGWQHPEQLSARNGVLTSKPMCQLEPQEVQAVLDSVCLREPETKRRYEHYKAWGSWDMRIW